MSGKSNVLKTREFYVLEKRVNTTITSEIEYI